MGGLEGKKGRLSTKGGSSGKKRISECRKSWAMLKDLRGCSRSRRGLSGTGARQLKATSGGRWKF